MKKPKITYCIPGTGISGGIAVVCQHLNRLKDRGYDVSMVSEDNNTDIHWFPNQRVHIYKMHEYPQDTDILVATGNTTAVSVHRLPAKRKMYFVQSDERRFYPKGSSSEVQAAQSYEFRYEYMTEARWIQDWLKTEYGHDSFYVPNGIDPEMFNDATPLQKRGKKLRVLIEGPMTIPFKNVQLAYAAIEPIEDIEIWMVTSDAQPPAHWKVAKHFSKVQMDRMKEIYASCDVLLKLSEVEGFFGPPMEMMACGGTAVVGNVTGHEEYCIHGENCLVVDLMIGEERTKRVEGIAAQARNAIIKLKEDKKLLEDLKKGGQETYKEWTWDRSIDMLEQLFNPQ